MPFRFLQGYRVLDLSQYAPGPYASLLLADLGADVVRIEPPGGEPMRRLGPRDADGLSAWYKAINRGKTIVALDLKSAAGKASFEALIGRADALLESYRPGVLDRLGFPDEKLAALYPRLIRCSLSGWGQTGPYRLKAGHDLNYLALCGGLALSGTSERPVASFPMVADHASGIQAALSILAALLGRDRKGGSGQGCRIDTSIAESVLPWGLWALTTLPREGPPFARAGGFLNGGAACYQIYRTKDGGFVTLGAVEQVFWANFCQAVGRPDWTARHTEPTPQDGLIAEVAALFMGRDRAAWETLLKAVDCCFEPVYEPDEVVNHPQIVARRMVVRRDGPEPVYECRFPAWIDGAPPPAAEPLRFLNAAEALATWAEPAHRS